MSEQRPKQIDETPFARVRFQFFDAGLDVQTDATPLGRDVQAWLLATHGRFRIGGRYGSLPGSLSPTTQIDVQIAEAAPDGVKVAIAGRSPWTLPAMPAAELGGLLVRWALAQVSSHSLLHAGAVSDDRRGLLLAGPSGAGKTTLVLELMERGLRFLSDETAALAQGWVHPFPRRIRVRGEPPDSMPVIEPNGSMAARTRWVDVEAAGGQIGEAVPVGAVVLLAGKAKRISPLFTLLCSRVDALWVAAVGALQSVDEAWQDDRWPFPALTYRAAEPVQAFMDIQALRHDYHVEILDVVEEPVASSFAADARLERISRSQAALALLPHLQNGLRSRYFHVSHHARPARLFTHLVRQLEAAACYRLYVGPLKPTANLLCSLLDDLCG